MSGEAEQLKAELKDRFQIRNPLLERAEGPWEVARVVVEPPRDVYIPSAAETFIKDAIVAGRYGLGPRALRTADDAVLYLWLRFGVEVGGDIGEVSTEFESWYREKFRPVAELWPIIERLRKEETTEDGSHRAHLRLRMRRRAGAGKERLAELKQRLSRADLDLPGDSVWAMLRGIEQIRHAKGGDRIAAGVDPALEEYRDLLRPLARPQWIETVDDLSLYLSLKLGIPNDGTLDDIERQLLRHHRLLGKDWGEIEETRGALRRLKVSSKPSRKRRASGQRLNNSPSGSLETVETFEAFAAYLFEVYGVHISAPLSQFQSRLHNLNMRLRGRVQSIEQLEPIIDELRRKGERTATDGLLGLRLTNKESAEVSELKQILRTTYGLQIEGKGLWAVFRDIERLRRESASRITSEIDALLDTYRSSYGPYVRARWVLSFSDLQLFVSLKFGIVAGETVDAIQAQLDVLRKRLLADIQAMDGDSPLMTRLRKAEVTDGDVGDGDEEAGAKPGVVRISTAGSLKSFASRGTVWGRAFPEPVVQMNGHPPLFLDYGFAMVRAGGAIKMGSLLPGDAAMIYSDNASGFAALQRFPFIGDEAKARKAIEEFLRRTSGRTPKELEVALARMGLTQEIQFPSPYEFEIGRVRRAYRSAGERAALSAVLVFADAIDDMPPAMTVALLEAAAMRGIPIADIAMLPPQRSPQDGDTILLDSMDGRIKIGNEAVIPLGGKGELAKPVLEGIEKFWKGVAEMHVGTEVRGHLASHVIPVAIGLWGREPEVLEQQLRRLLGEMGGKGESEQSAFLKERMGAARRMFKGVQFVDGSAQLTPAQLAAGDEEAAAGKGQKGMTSRGVGSPQSAASSSPTRSIIMKAR